MDFYVGFHNPAQVHHFERCMVSVNRLWNRKSDIKVNDWILDSGAFTHITKHGDYQHPVSEYARRVERWAACGNLKAAVSQDYMCEPFVLARTGLTVAEHQRRTVDRYAELRARVDPAIHIMPVLQGYAIEEYLSHIEQYGALLARGMWVGVGSVCKRNSRVGDIEAILSAILDCRPDLRLHGFGIKTTSLKSAVVREALHSADSMAWSFAARREGRGPDANKWTEAAAFVERIKAIDNSLQ